MLVFTANGEIRGSMSWKMLRMSSAKESISFGLIILPLLSAGSRQRQTAEETPTTRSKTLSVPQQRENG